MVVNKEVQCIETICVFTLCDRENYIFRRYVPELRDFPVEFLYEPWRASLEIQMKAGCIIGKDYPEPMVNHQEASYKNREVSKYYIEYICTLFNHFFKSLLKKLLLK